MVASEGTSTTIQAHPCHGLRAPQLGLPIHGPGHLRGWAPTAPGSSAGSFKVAPLPAHRLHSSIGMPQRGLPAAVRSPDRTAPPSAFPHTQLHPRPSPCSSGPAPAAPRLPRSGWGCRGQTDGPVPFLPHRSPLVQPGLRLPSGCWHSALDHVRLFTLQDPRPPQQGCSQAILLPLCTHSCNCPDPTATLGPAGPHSVHTCPLFESVQLPLDGGINILWLCS